MKDNSDNLVNEKVLHSYITLCKMKQAVVFLSQEQYIHILFFNNLSIRSMAVEASASYH